MRRLSPIRPVMIALVVASALIAPASARVAGSSPGSAQPDARVLRKDGANLWQFALDGTRMTWAAWNGTCDVIATWDIYRGGWRTSGSTGSCYDSPVEIAAAGGRIAWLMESGSLSDAGFQLMTGRYGGRRPATVLITDAPIESPSGGPGNVESYEIGDLVGGGNTLAYLTWTVHPNGASGSERAWQLTTTGRRVLLGELPGTRALAIDGDQVVALLRDATLHFLGDGARTVKLATDSAALQTRHDYDLAVTDGQALVLGRRTLQVFDSTTGARIASWPLPAVELSSRGLLDAAGGYASYLSKGTIHVMRLADGKDVVIPPTRLQPARCTGGNVWAQLSSVGLTYALAPPATCTTSRAGVITFSELATYF